MRPMMFNFFMMNTPSHLHHGTWRHPESRSLSYNDLDFWIDLARLAERGKLDAIFFADVFGLYSGSWDDIIKRAIQFPISDPSVMISALAAATSNLSFIYTSSILQQHPFNFARQISTLDHLTKGRVGWNIVTTASENGARSMGQKALTDHDERYRWAEEYMEVVYKLWEGSWDEGAVIVDRTNSLYADPQRIHRINHIGERYSVEGPHLVEPSPQRTPALFQAGSSPAGLGFAAKHAEAAFLISGPPEASQDRIRKLRELVIAEGRPRDAVHFVEGLVFVIGSTEEEARRKEKDIESYMDFDAERIMFGAVTGIDLSQYDPTTKLVDLIEHSPGMRTMFLQVIDGSSAKSESTIADMFRYSTRKWRIVGTPESIADRLQVYRDGGVTGVNLIYMTVPGTFVDFVDHLAPVLQHRGLMQREYSPGNLRQKMFPERGPYLPKDHNGSAYRNV